MQSSFEQFKKDFQDFPFGQADDMSWLKSIKFKISHISSLRRLVGRFCITLMITPEFSSLYIKHFFGAPLNSKNNLFWYEITQKVNESKNLSLKFIWKSCFLDESSKYENGTKSISNSLKNLLHKSYLSFISALAITLSIFALATLPFIILPVLVIFSFNMQIDPRGFYSAALSNRTLYVMKGRKKIEHFDPVISHEHIHMIQDEMYKSGFIQNLTFNNFSVNAEIFNFETLKKYKEKVPVNYLFSPLEIEARLHEIVLTYYRSKKSMPRNAVEFVEMIMNFKLLTLNTEENYKILLETRFYSGVETYFIAQIEVLKTESAAMFLQHVLPIFYRRLLTYYGATELISEFDKNPPDTTLFDKLFTYH